MSEVKEPRGEHLLETLVEIVSEEAARVLNANPDIARLLGDEVATRFSAEFGGLQCYLPKGKVFHTSRLYRQIFDEFTGANQIDLAREHGVSVIHIYRVIARERERDRLERQQTLPGVTL